MGTTVYNPLRHRQYHDAHFVTVRVENPEAGGEGS